MDQRFVDDTALGKFHDRDIETFFVDASSISPKTTPADVYNMGGAGKEPHKSAVVKRRCDHGDIMQMAGAFPGIIGDVDITLKYILRSDPPNEVAHGVSHGVDVARGAGHSLCQHPTVCVIDTGRQIPGLSH